MGGQPFGGYGRIREMPAFRSLKSLKWGAIAYLQRVLFTILSRAFDWSFV
jgi:hypothetical protein